MDFHQFYGLTGTDISFEFPQRNLACTEWAFDPIKLAPGNSPDSPLSSQFKWENLSVVANSQEQHNMASIQTVSPSRYSLMDSVSSVKQSEGHFEKGIQVHSNSFYAVPSQSIMNALQEIETVLMAPDAEEPKTTTDPEIKENKPQIMKKQSRSSDQKTQYQPDRHPNPCHEVRTEKRLREMSKLSGSDVKWLLIKCAEALAENKIKEFELLVEKAWGAVSVGGEPIQRLGAYMIEGLVARNKSSGSTIYRGLQFQKPENKELLSQMRIMHDICPYFKFGYMAANGAIADALKTENRIHIIDFQIAQGTQWITLIQALAVRPGGPPHVRITGIDEPESKNARGDSLQLVGKMLSEMSRNFKIPLEFKGLAVNGPEVTREMLDIRPGEAIAVNFTFQLHHTPDEGVDVNNPRDGLLRMVKGLSPKVTTLVEQESNTNTTPFLTRFIETLDYYSAMLESIDVTLSRDSKQRITVEQHCLAKDIVNIIACEGKDRIERHELLGKWRSRFTMAGFKPYPLSSYVNSVIKTLLGYYSDKYTLEEKEGALLLGWKNRNLISASAWH
ncbi:chitin-inducible gibberellin-responsive protein 1 [Canna indica]|uniref:Chitin-inducible gibberellin-responsive protein 1 n=1 Tax=Canna indica TaxID=4628 RepID=A0AAQ3K9W2_9LILI|nr:chitin-inducible gibberellin-responsive protein 1 [Canna indica]